MKKLFLLIQNCGDGSYCVRYTMNEKWVKEQEEKCNNDEIDLEYEIGFDGDGFHYDIIYVPEICTLNSLGIIWDCSNE